MKPYLFILIFLACSNARAQPISITGTVAEKTSRESLQGATVYLSGVQDSTVLAGQATDSTGRFFFGDLAPAAYVLNIRFIGFEPFSQQVLPDGAKDLGAIFLNVSGELLNQVSVTADGSRLVYDLDKQIYQVGQDVFSEAGTASDILQNIPSVNVDINGAITLRNTSNITFFINGRPSAMLRRNAAGYLEQIPARSIERIEVITNPSARYRPDGVGGIINIVMKKDPEKGLNGLISGNIGTEDRKNANISLHYGSEALGFYGNYGIRSGRPTYLFTDDRQYKDGNTVTGTYTEDGYSAVDALSHTLVAGSNFEPDDNNKFEISGSWFLQNSLHSGSSDIGASGSAGDVLFANRQTNDEFEGEGEGSLAWEHVFKNNEDHNLALEYACSAFSEREDLAFEQTYAMPAGNVVLNDILIEKSGRQHEWRLDYALPVGEDAEIEAGYAGEYIFEDIRYTNVTPSRFQLRQDVQAVYGLWAQEFDAFRYKAGLRAEQATIQPHLIVPNDLPARNRYFKVFPTLHLGYAPDDNSQFSLSYSKRINRPDADELNPNPEYSDPRNAESGNPDIRPEQVHSIELGCQIKRAGISLAPVLYYRYKYDAFTSIRTSLNDSIVLSTLANLDNGQSGGLETVLKGALPKVLDFDLTGNVFYTTLDAGNLGFSERSSAVSGNLKLNTRAVLWKNTKLQMGAFYYFPGITPQGKTKPFFYLNGGLRQSVFRNRAALILTVTDIFHTYKRIRQIDSDALAQTTTLKRKRPIVYLGFSWRFNNYKTKDDFLYDGEGLRK